MKLSYEDAYFYKLLLQAGFSTYVNSWIEKNIYTNDSLEGIDLELAINYGDVNKVISCLNSYIGEEKINDKNIYEKILNFISERYKNGEITIEGVVESLYSFVCITEKFYDDYWYEFYEIGEHYKLIFDGLIDSNVFYLKLEEYLEKRVKINFSNIIKKNKLLDVIKKEKKEMNSIRFRMNYIIVPLFLIFMIVILTIIGITLSINEEKYTPLAIVLFSIFGVGIIGLLVSVTFVRKKEIKIELAKYDFTINNEMKEKYYLKTTNGNEAIFTKDYMIVDNKKYLYDDFEIILYTSNYLLNVRINVEFVLVNSSSYVNPYWNFRLNNDLLNAIMKYEIKLNNYKLLNYIINNKEAAFKHIFLRGYIESKLYEG